MKQQDIYQSLLVITTGLLILAWIFQWPVLVYIAGGIGLISLVIPPIGRLIVKGWMLFAVGLGWINSKIILGLIYYLMLTPIAFFYRILGGDPLKLSDDYESVYSSRNHTYTADDMENMW